MNERDYDNYLHINTIGNQLHFYESLQYHRYEPTPYLFLKKLSQSYPFSRNDHVVDFGCGKGRLNFFLHHYTGVSVTGVEMNKDFYEEAKRNFQHYQKKHGKPKAIVDFYHGLAEDYPISEENNVFYFFNPFSIHIFRNIIHRILQSVEFSPRRISIILYYPSEEYVDFLERIGLFQLKQVVLCVDNDPFERFLVYELLG